MKPYLSGWCGTSDCHGCTGRYPNGERAAKPETACSHHCHRETGRRGEQDRPAKAPSVHAGALSGQERVSGRGRAQRGSEGSQPVRVGRSL